MLIQIFEDTYKYQKRTYAIEKPLMYEETVHCLWHFGNEAKNAYMQINLVAESLLKILLTRFQESDPYSLI